MGEPSVGTSRRPHFLRIAVLAVVLVLLLFALRSSRPTLVTFQGQTMGTTYMVRVITPVNLGRPEAAELNRDIDAVLDRVNRLMSTYLPDSELSRFNRHDEVTPVRLSEETIHVLWRSGQISELTGGAFDITVGPMVNAYGFGPDPEPATLPADEQIDEIRQRIGYHLLEVDPQSRTVRKLRPDVYCDLSAIAKGYAVDQVADLLETSDYKDYMVEVGGEVRTRGLNANHQPWQIGIQRPDSAGGVIEGSIGLTDKAVASSGDYRNFYVRDGKRYSHAIDPRTGRTVTHDLAGVSVVADDCETADALATAFMVLGPAEGYNLAEKQGIAALFLVRQADGAIVERASPAWSSVEVVHSGPPASAAATQSS